MVFESAVCCEFFLFELLPDCDVLVVFFFEVDLVSTFPEGVVGGVAFILS